MGMLGGGLGLRSQAVARGRRLEYVTIVYNSLEGLVALVAGWLAGSVALVGFGFDSIIEVSSGAALLLRLNADADPRRRARMERFTLGFVGVCFLALAAYVSYDSLSNLIRHEPPRPSIIGIVLAATSLIVMPLLARAKRRVAREISSGAMAADAKQTEFCMYLSAILLVGLILNAAFGWWWADPLAGLIMVPIIAREGIGALRGKACDCSLPRRVRVMSGPVEDTRPAGLEPDGATMTHLAIPAPCVLRPVTTAARLPGSPRAWPSPCTAGSGLAP